MPRSRTLIAANGHMHSGPFGQTPTSAVVEIAKQSLSPWHDWSKSALPIVTQAPLSLVPPSGVPADGAVEAVQPARQIVIAMSRTRGDRHNERRVPRLAVMRGKTSKARATSMRARRPCRLPSLVTGSRASSRSWRTAYAWTLAIRCVAIPPCSIRQQRTEVRDDGRRRLFEREV